MGQFVILVAPTGHLGGMTSSGLGWTDIGNDKILGGLSREFYHRVYQHYQQDEAWTQQERGIYAEMKGQGVPAFNKENELASVFEPKVAEAVFDAMAAEAGFKIIHGRLDLEDGVMKLGRRMTSIRLEDDTTIQGRMSIDASYEGDLLPRAGVSYVMGRESNADLLVPWALSATHIAFGSIRMEPVFMVLGQSAATAAAQAIEAGIPVQQVNYSKLRPRLLADGQKLD